jgi:GT2 family glycosyltransferase
VFLSQDAHPIGPGWLAALVAPLADGSAQAAYGRQVAPPGDAERAATFGFLYPDMPERKTRADIARLGIRAFHLSDVTSAFDAAILRQVRFPEDLPTFEDVGVAKRLLDAGHAIAYVPEAQVAHGDTMAAGSLFRRYRQIGAVYERLGIFAELKRATGRGLARAGLQTAGAVTPSTAGPVRRLVVAGTKAAGVLVGRMQTKLGAPLPKA